MRKIDPITGVTSVIASIFILLPLIALFNEVQWNLFFSHITSSSSLMAIKLSLWTSILATAIAILFGVPLGWYLARGTSNVTNTLRPFVLAPIVLPPTVAGMAMLALLGRNGLLGKYVYSATGWAMPFTSTAVVVIGVFVGMPFLALIVESAFRNLPQETEDAARISGATNRHLFLHVGIPVAKNSIAAGAILAWARALGEFGATMMFAGSLPGSTQTWAMQVYLDMDVDQSTAYSLSSVMVFIAVCVVFLSRKQLRAAFSR